MVQTGAQAGKVLWSGSDSILGAWLSLICVIWAAANSIRFNSTDVNGGVVGTNVTVRVNTTAASFANCLEQCMGYSSEHPIPELPDNYTESQFTLSQSITPTTA
jgi:hypothetical protein